MIAVWEPVLPTDFMAPSESVLARLADPRVIQLWDPDNLLSDDMREGMEDHPSDIPISRRRTGDSDDGTLWDAVAVFGSGSTWKATMPAPVWLDGIVVQVIPQLTAWISGHRNDGKN